MNLETAHVFLSFIVSEKGICHRKQLSSNGGLNSLTVLFLIHIVDVIIIEG